MKKIIALFLSLLIIFALSACNKNDKQTQQPTNQAVQNNEVSVDADTKSIWPSAYVGWKEYKSYSTIATDGEITDHYSFKVPYTEVQSFDGLRSKVFKGEDGKSILFIPQEFQFEENMTIEQYIKGESSYVLKMIGAFYSGTIDYPKLTLGELKTFSIGQKGMNKYVGVLQGKKEDVDVYYNVNLYFQATENKTFVVWLMMEPAQNAESTMTKESAEIIRQVAYSYNDGKKSE